MTNADGSPSPSRPARQRRGAPRTCLVRVYLAASDSVVRMWTLPDGSTSWVPVTTTGLPPYAEVIENTPDGGYVASSGGRDKFTFYRSPDLRTRSAVTVSQAR